MNHNLRLTVCTGVALAVLLSVESSRAEGRDAAAYVGVKTCGMCHKKEDKGNQLGVWKASAHAKAFEVLASPEAKATATKAGVDDPQKSGKCLQCHSTAYNWTETVQAPADKLPVEEGVSCESCHGPGKDYKSATVMKDKAKAVAAGMIDPATKSCELCHNDKSPTWNPERYTTADGKKVGFDATQAAEKIKHKDPTLGK